MNFWNLRPVEKVAKVGRCVVCNSRPGDGLVPVYRAFPSFNQTPSHGGLRVEWIGSAGNYFEVMRDEAWCRPCGEKVLQREAGPIVWYNVERGWV